MKKAGRGFGIVLIMLAVVLAIAAVTISLTCTGRTPVYLSGLPDPQDTLTAFFDGVCEQDYAAAYACMTDYQTLGLENTPSDPYAAAFETLLRENTSWEQDGECRVSGTSAETEVSVTTPDLSLLTDNLGSDINARVEEAAASGQEGIYDDSGAYSSEFLLSVYDEVLQERLGSTALPLHTETVTVSLTYDGEQWLVEPDEQLFSALNGGLS